MIDLTTSKTTVEATLQRFLNEKQQGATVIHSSYRQLLDEIHRVVFSGGKRLRPHLVFLGYGAYDDTVSMIAAAHELLHTALLAHDDIIDRDLVRHGQPTIHAAYDKAYTDDLTNPLERAHFSESAALLAGDLLISFAYELIARAELPAKTHAAVTTIMAEGMFEVIGGELMDTEAAFVDNPADPLTIYRYKTASYSIIAPLLSGAVMSPIGYDQSSLNALRNFATKAGVAYQIQDDILGVFGRSGETGKSTVGDLREGKRTLLIEHFTKAASADQMALFSRTFGNTLASDDEFDLLKDALRDSGALASTKAAVTDYTQAALSTLQSVPDRELTDNLTGLADALITRKA
ncbi:MAG TPA: polyprenyl synthetase family protein [Candidatus Saccharibacteria bacterium]|nr:polyprenyl synthetase family protein [Candidatus Saccharibacteria bacterium]